jgi:hypothetical protein
MSEHASAFEALDPFYPTGSAEGRCATQGSTLRPRPTPLPVRLFRKPFAKGRAEGLEFRRRTALQIACSKNI